MSLDSLGDEFDWIKEELKGRQDHGKFAWCENENQEIDARDIVILLI